jgi:MFS family permease
MQNQAGHLPSRGRTLVAATVGSAFEFFDLTVYSFFAPIIGKLFFPAGNGQLEILLSVAAFGIGYLTRPIGGALFGYMADRHGRLLAMRMTLFLMALGTGMIAFAPTYASIGIAAPIIIVMARMLQGLSAGGQIGPATALLLEHASARNRGFIASWQFASQGGAAAMGALVGFLLTTWIPKDMLNDWGWRLPFIFGMLVAPLGMWLRETVEVNDDAVHAQSIKPQRGGLLRELLRDYPRIVFITFLMVLSGAATQAIVLFYLPTYAVTSLGMPSAATLGAAIAGGALTFILAPVGGALSDKFGRKPVSQLSRVGIALLVYPAFLVLTKYPSTLTLSCVFVVLGTLHGINVGSAGPIYGEVFPRHIRSTGMAVPYGLAVAIFGGFAPFIAESLVRLSGDKLMPAWYVVACAVPAIIGIFFLPETSQGKLED